MRFLDIQTSRKCRPQCFPAPVPPYKPTTATNLWVQLSRVVFLLSYSLHELKPLCPKTLNRKLLCQHMNNYTTQLLRSARCPSWDKTQPTAACGFDGAQLMRLQEKQILQQQFHTIHRMDIVLPIPSYIKTKASMASWDHTDPSKHFNVVQEQTWM